ncbi:MAG: hypothetical protein QNJ46_21780 [Leptolyngbyaceae cyanobacterium MO_188.B28]|nr:hypothetical protein [Leptolyngbyaceae cyanobacterium MO_188.B28]
MSRHLSTLAYPIEVLIDQYNLYLRKDLNYRLFNQGLRAGLERSPAEMKSPAYRKGYELGLSY